MRSDRLSVDRPRLLVLAGYLLAIDACYLLATSRWGSYVGVPHRKIYIGDVVFAASLASWVCGGGPSLLWRRARRSPVLWTVVALVLWTLVRLAAGSIDAVSLRDAAPYLYLLAVPIVMTAPIPSRPVFLMAAIALTLHVAWLTLVLQRPSWFSGMPHLGPTQLFELRDDYDQAVAGIAASLGVVGALRSPRLRYRVGWLGLTAIGVWDISQLMNRGGVLASFVCLLAVVVAVVWEQRRAATPRRERATKLAVGLGLCVAVGVGLLQSPSFHRLTFGISGTTGISGQANPTAPSSPNSSPTTKASSTALPGAPSHQASPPPRGAKAQPTPTTSAPPNESSHQPTIAEETAGTTEARKVAWRDVYHYMTKTVTRTIVGVGFGPNFLQAAGALELLSGGIPGLRAPHNILLNTWARLGLIGLVLHLLLLAFAALAAVRYILRRPMQPETVSVFILGALATAAMVGVILESPFGAIPFAYALGRLARIAPTTGSVVDVAVERVQNREGSVRIQQGADSSRG